MADGCAQGHMGVLQDLGLKKVGSRIWDKHPGSATLISGLQYCFYF
jgi:hypothetical protein